MRIICKCFNLLNFTENKDDASVENLNEEEVVTFNADMHMNFVEETFSWFGVNDS